MIFSTSLPRFKTFLGDAGLKASDLACCLLLITPERLSAENCSAGWNLIPSDTFLA